MLSEEYVVFFFLWELYLNRGIMNKGSSSPKNVQAAT